MTDFTSAYIRASKTFRAVTELSMRPLGLHLGQHLLLARLAERDGQTPGELAAAIRVTVPTVVKMSGRMAKAGWLTRRRDDRDNRLVRLHLTPAGRALLEPIQSALEDIDTRATAGLSERERAQLLKLLDRVSTNAEKLLQEWNAEAADCS